MESEVFTPLLEQFMLTPLVSWVSGVRNLSVACRTDPSRMLCVFYISTVLTCVSLQVKTVGQLATSDGSKLSEYIELVDGIYLNEVMLEM